MTIWRDGVFGDSQRFSRRYPERTEQAQVSHWLNDHGQLVGVGVQWHVTGCDVCGEPFANGARMGTSADGEWVHVACDPSSAP